MRQKVLVRKSPYLAGAIAYRREALQTMISDAGLGLKRDFLRGAWSGYYPNPEDGQDVMIICSPEGNGN